MSLKFFKLSLPIVLLLIAVLFYSCWGLGFAYLKHLSGNYYLLACDSKEQMSIAYKDTESSYIGIVSEKVLAVGYNNNFIIAKQISVESQDSISDRPPAYYIIDIRDTRREDFLKTAIEEIDNVPLDRYFPLPALKMSYDEYLIKRRELNIPDSLQLAAVVAE